MITILSTGSHHDLLEDIYAEQYASVSFGAINIHECICWNLHMCLNPYISLYYTASSIDLQDGNSVVQ